MTGDLRDALFKIQERAQTSNVYYIRWGFSCRAHSVLLAGLGRHTLPYIRGLLFQSPMSSPDLFRRTNPSSVTLRYPNFLCTRHRRQSRIPSRFPQCSPPPSCHTPPQSLKGHARALVAVSGSRCQLLRRALATRSRHPRSACTGSRSRMAVSEEEDTVSA